MGLLQTLWLLIACSCASRGRALTFHRQDLENILCHNLTGACPANLCKPGYYAPNCQIESLKFEGLTEGSNPPNHLFSSFNLVDGNVATIAVYNVTEKPNEFSVFLTDKSNVSQIWVYFFSIFQDIFFTTMVDEIPCESIVRSLTYPRWVIFVCNPRLHGKRITLSYRFQYRKTISTRKKKFIAIREIVVPRNFEQLFLQETLKAGDAAGLLNEKTSLFENVNVTSTQGFENATTESGKTLRIPWYIILGIALGSIAIAGLVAWTVLRVKNSRNKKKESLQTQARLRLQDDLPGEYDLVHTAPTYDYIESEGSRDSPVDEDYEIPIKQANAKGPVAHCFGKHKHYSTKEAHYETVFQNTHPEPEYTALTPMYENLHGTTSMQNRRISREPKVSGSS